MQLSLSAKSGLTKRALDAGDSAAFSSIFLASSFLCSQTRVHARPSASNANRWQASQRAKAKPSLIRKLRFIVKLEKQFQFF